MGSSFVSLISAPLYIAIAPLWTTVMYEGTNQHFISAEHLKGVHVLFIHSACPQSIHNIAWARVLLLEREGEGQ